MRRAIDQTLTTASSPIPAHQVGAQARLIEEHQTVHGQAKLLGLPLRAPGLDLGPLLLRSQNYFF